MNAAIKLMERGLIPEPLVRHGIRRLLRDRLKEQSALFDADRERALASFVRGMRHSQVALVPDKANEQHYEVPPAFFQLVLGNRLKYSSAFYQRPDSTLDEAEETMLALTCERADLRDGQRVLELGCGWGSLTLWMAEHYPNSRITAVSNSAPQRRFIEAQAAERGLHNLEIVTCDMNEFEGCEGIDRVVSVEMFEHMRNWEELLGRVSGWLSGPDARVFLHVFAHQRYAYPFEDRDSTDWMSRYFFSGGLMPAHDLVDHLESPFEVDERWVVSGEHYARTSEDWVRNLDQHRQDVLEVFTETYGKKDAGMWFQRWRTFFLACAELFAFDGGSEWIVSHQRLKPSGQPATRTGA